MFPATHHDIRILNAWRTRVPFTTTTGLHHNFCCFTPFGLSPQLLGFHHNYLQVLLGFHHNYWVFTTTSGFLPQRPWPSALLGLQQGERCAPLNRTQAGESNQEVQVGETKMEKREGTAAVPNQDLAENSRSHVNRSAVMFMECFHFTW